MPESPMGLTLKSDEKLSSIVPYDLQISLFYAVCLSSHTAIYYFFLALQPSAGYGLLVHEVS
jgi:hypothetical protein